MNADFHLDVKDDLLIAIDIQPAFIKRENKKSLQKFLEAFAFYGT